MTIISSYNKIEYQRKEPRCVKLDAAKEAQIKNMKRGRGGR